jgi:hypothetical protein
VDVREAHLHQDLADQSSLVSHGSFFLGMPRRAYFFSSLSISSVKVFFS